MKLLRFLTHETEGVLLTLSLNKEASAQPDFFVGLAFTSVSFVIMYIMVVYAVYFYICGAHNLHHPSYDHT